MSAAVLLWCAGFVLASWPSWGPLMLVDDLSASTGVHGLVVAAIAAGALLCKRPESVRIQPRTVFITILLFLAWSGCSLFWTTAGDQRAAVGYWGVAAAEVLGVALLARRADPAAGCVRFAEGLVAGATVLSLVAIFRFGTDAGRLGDAMVLHPNLVAHWAAIGIMTCAALITSRSSMRLVYGIAGLFLTCVVVSTFSKTVMLALPIAMAAFLAVLFRRRAAWLTGLGVMVTAFVIAAQNGAVDYLSDYMAAQGRLETLSGRTILWDETWQQITAAKWLGHGFMSFRDQVPQIFTVRLVHAHNELLNIWFALGAIGVVIVAAIYAVALWQVVAAIRNRRTDIAGLTLALWVFCVIRGLTEASPTTIVLPLPMLVILSTWAQCRVSEQLPPSRITALRPLVV